MDVVTFGETMVLFYPPTVGPLRFATTFHRSIGGAESNVAICLARLGHQAGWFSRLGNDEFGVYVRNFIRGEGVDTSRVLFDDQFPTGLFFKERQAMQEPRVTYYRKDSAASKLSPADVDEEYLSRAKFLHLTGITPALGPSCLDAVHHAITLAKKHGLTVVFDPNIRLKLWTKERAREVLLEVAKKCDIVMPGLEEGEILTGQTSPEEIAKVFLQTGVNLAVIKLGEKGAYYATCGADEYVPGFPVAQIVDPIGAGDGFAGGFLSGLIRGWPYRKAVELGNRIGAYALTVAGDVEGYPFESQIFSDQTKEIKR